MAASILQRCLIPARTFSKCVDYRLIGRRSLLSAAYTDASVWEQRLRDPQNLSQLASLMDRTYERKRPVSSLVIARFIDSLSSKEEVEQAEYYLYKFRHSPNCWYLRDWSIHSWIRQCLKHGARDKALYTLKNKVQFGIFPDDFTFNIMIDSFLKDKDFAGACSVVEEVMLQESFERISTQILSLSALSGRLASQPELSWQEERSVGAALLLAGLKQENSAGISARLLGLALIGKVEQTRGIHAVFHEMPLLWSSGYLRRALDVMDAVASGDAKIRLSEEVLDRVERILQDLSAVSHEPLDEGDELERLNLPQYVQRFSELKERLRAEQKLDPQALEAQVRAVAEQEISACEEEDLREYGRMLELWTQEREQLQQRERQARAHAEQRESLTHTHTHTEQRESHAHTH